MIAVSAFLEFGTETMLSDSVVIKAMCSIRSALRTRSVYMAISTVCYALIHSL